MIDREAEGSDSLEVRSRLIGLLHSSVLNWAVIAGIYAHALDSRRHWLRSWIFLA